MSSSVSFSFNYTPTKIYLKGFSIKHLFSLREKLSNNFFIKMKVVFFIFAFLIATTYGVKLTAKPDGLYYNGKKVFLSGTSFYR